MTTYENAMLLYFCNKIMRIYW